MLTTIRSLVNSCSSHCLSLHVHTPTIAAVYIALQWRKLAILCTCCVINLIHCTSLTDIISSLIKSNTGSQDFFVYMCTYRKVKFINIEGFCRKRLPRTSPEL